jgi:hypothetical protein
MYVCMFARRGQTIVGRVNDLYGEIWGFCVRVVCLFGRQVFVCKVNYVYDDVAVVSGRCNKISVSVSVGVMSVHTCILTQVKALVCVHEKLFALYTVNIHGYVYVYVYMYRYIYTHMHRDQHWRRPACLEVWEKWDPSIVYAYIYTHIHTCT